MNMKQLETKNCQGILDTCSLALKRYYSTRVVHEREDYIAIYTNWTYKLADRLDISFVAAAELVHNKIGQTLCL